MATQRTHPPSDDSALTQCPGCSVVFEIDADMLDKPDTRVRCGDCLTVFDARVNRYYEGQIDETPQPPDPKPSDPDPSEQGNDSSSSSDALVAQAAAVSKKPPSISAPASGIHQPSPAPLPEPRPEPRPAPRPEPPARSSLLEESEGPAAVRLAPASGSREFSEFDVTYADFDLFSEEAGLPEVVFDDTPSPQDADSSNALHRDQRSDGGAESHQMHQPRSTRDGSVVDGHVDYDTGASTDALSDGNRVQGANHSATTGAGTDFSNPGGQTSGLRKSRLKASGRRTARAIGNWQFDRNDTPGSRGQSVSDAASESADQPAANANPTEPADAVTPSSAEARADVPSTRVDDGWQAQQRKESLSPSDNVNEHRSWADNINQPGQSADSTETFGSQKPDGHRQGGQRPDGQRPDGQDFVKEVDEAKAAAFFADDAEAPEARAAEESAESFAESAFGLTAEEVQAEKDRAAEEEAAQANLKAARAAGIRAAENARADAQLAEQKRLAEAHQAELEAAKRQRADDLAAQARAAEVAKARAAEADALRATEAARAATVASAAKSQDFDEKVTAPWVTEPQTDSLDDVFADGDYFEPDFGDDADFGGTGNSTPRSSLLTKVAAGIGGVVAFLSGGRWMRGIMIAGLILVLLGLYMYRERATLVNNSVARPIMASWCWVAGCELAPRFDPAQLAVLQRQIYSHPDKEKTLVINIVMRNDAEFNQRYPVLVVNLTDIGGSLVASERFTSSVYLAGLRLQDSKAFPAKTSLQIAIEMDDPGSNARSFKLEFR